MKQQKTPAITRRRFSLCGGDSLIQARASARSATRAAACAARCERCSIRWSEEYGDHSRGVLALACLTDDRGIGLRHWPQLVEHVVAFQANVLVDGHAADSTFPLQEGQPGPEFLHRAVS